MRAAFLDLNGTLVDPVRVTELRELTVLPCAIEAVRLLNQAHLPERDCKMPTISGRVAASGCKRLLGRESMRHALHLRRLALTQRIAHELRAHVLA